MGRKALDVTDFPLVVAIRYEPAWMSSRGLRLKLGIRFGWPHMLRFFISKRTRKLAGWVLWRRRIDWMRSEWIEA
jgi:hypothetical protein